MDKMGVSIQAVLIYICLILCPFTVDAIFSNLYCTVTFQECCNDNWISTNYADLKRALETKVYGQHLVTGPLLKLLKAHAVLGSNKALVLSFHGMPGTGKTYVSNIIVDTLYKRGVGSKFVHLFSSEKDFPHKEYLSEYKDKLRSTIEAGVRACPRSMFIFEEMHLMPRGLIDTIKSYVNSFQQLGGVDYRKATFIFLSNAASNDIFNKTFEHWKQGLERETLLLKDMEEVIKLSSYNSDAGLSESDIVSEGFISAYIPFLPLERRHVKDCIRDVLLEKGFYKTRETIPEDKVQEVADELTYYPKGVQLYSHYGCRKVLDKTFLVIDDDSHTEL